jgi:hypothetical protein
MDDTEQPKRRKLTAAEAVSDLRAMALAGQIQLAPGNTVVPMKQPAAPRPAQEEDQRICPKEYSRLDIERAKWEGVKIGFLGPLAFIVFFFLWWWR